MSTRSKAKRRKKGMGWGEKIGIVVVLLIVIWAAYSLSQPPPPTGPSQNSTAPDFTLPVVGTNGLTGQKVSLSSFRGKVVLLEFMIPSCVHCQNMAPELESLYQQFGSENVVFLSIVGLSYGESVDDVANFIRTYHTSWYFVYDSSNTVFNMYGVQATPYFFIIAKNGQVATSYEGETAPQTLASDLTRVNV